MKRPAEKAKEVFGLDSGALFENAVYPCLELNENFEPVRMNAAAAECFSTPDILHTLLTEDELLQLRGGQPVQRPWYRGADRHELLQILPVKDGYLAAVSPLTGAANGFQESLERMIHDVQGLFAALPALQFFLNENTQSLQMMEYVLRQSYSLLRELTDHCWCSRLASGQPLELQTLDLNELLEVLCTAIPTVMPDTCIEYTGTGAPVYVRADRTLLEMIFTHLVRNSVQFSGDERRVAVSLQKLRSRAAVQVSDSGLGIQPQVAARIFEPYCSCDPYDDGGTAPGSGMGLYIVRQGLHALGGEIALETEFGSGTKTTFTLPLTDGPVPEVHAAVSDYTMDRLSCVQLQFAALGARIKL